VSPRGPVNGMRAPAFFLRWIKIPPPFSVPLSAVTDCLTIWTIYRRPTDYPDSWVLRGHEVLRDGTQAHKFCFVAPTLDEVRAKVPPGTRRVGREPGDHPVIYESWVAATGSGRDG
jgi:hypothetical protein